EYVRASPAAKVQGAGSAFPLQSAGESGRPRLSPTSSTHWSLLAHKLHSWPRQNSVGLQHIGIITRYVHLIHFWLNRGSHLRISEGNSPLWSLSVYPIRTARLSDLRTVAPFIACHSTKPKNLGEDCLPDVDFA